MSGRSRVLDLAMAELEGELTSSPHPSLDDLAAYYRKSLPEAAARVIQDHLVTCRECTAALLDLDELAAEGRTAAPAPPSPETEVAWERLRQQLPPLEVAPAPPLPFRPRASRAPVWRWAAAAALLLSTGTLGYLALGMQSRLDELEEPQLNIAEIDLDPSPVRGAAKPVELPLGPRAERFQLVLNQSQETSFADYEIVVQRADGKKVFSIRGQPNALTLSFKLTVPRRLMPDGDYDIELAGLAGGRKEVIERYQLRLVTATTP